MYMIKFMTSSTSLISKHYVEKQKILMQRGTPCYHILLYFYSKHGEKDSTSE